mmetsp:Transcript_23859/g.76101  ORF Transcript_23859/g.76101 Transcript_23859/m.76101 type:complete len:209 (+) Transcript_23859:1130-1756(+)
MELERLPVAPVVWRVRHSLPHPVPDARGGVHSRLDRLWPWHAHRADLHAPWTRSHGVGALAHLDDVWRVLHHLGRRHSLSWIPRQDAGGRMPAGVRGQPHFDDRRHHPAADALFFPRGSAPQGHRALPPRGGARLPSVCVVRPRRDQRPHGCGPQAEGARQRPHTQPAPRIPRRHLRQQRVRHSVQEGHLRDRRAGRAGGYQVQQDVC